MKRSGEGRDGGRKVGSASVKCDTPLCSTTPSINTDKEHLKVWRCSKPPSSRRGLMAGEVRGGGGGCDGGGMGG